MDIIRLCAFGYAALLGFVILTGYIPAAGRYRRQLPTPLIGVGIICTTNNAAWDR